MKLNPQKKKIKSLDKNKWANCIPAVRWARVQFWGVRRSTSERHRHHPRTTIARSRHTGAWRGEARRGGAKRGKQTGVSCFPRNQKNPSISLSLRFHLSSSSAISLSCTASRSCASSRGFFFGLPILCNEAVGVVVSRVCGFYNFEKLRECFVDVVVLFSSRTGSGSALT